MDSETATPETGPAYDPFDTDSTTEHILGLLGTGDTATPTNDAEPATEESQAAPDGEQSTEEAEGKDPGQQAETTPEPTYRVKVRGEDREVPLSELLNGYSRTEDYKAKTAEVAEQRKAIEAERTDRLQRIDKVLDAVSQFDPVLVEGNQTDWLKLAQEDPLTYTQKRAQYDARIQQVQALQAQRGEMAAQASREILQRSYEALVQAIPDWADEGKRTKMAGEIKNNLKHYGFSDDDLSSLSDHRAVLVARDALAWRNHLASLEAAKAKASAPVPPKTLKPGSAETGSRTPDARAKALKSNALRTGKTDDAVAAILAAL